MIPKRIFYFWGEGTQISWMRYMTLKSCRVLNPNWEIILYTSKCNVKKKTWSDAVQQDFFEYGGEDYFSKVKDLGIEIRDWDILNKKFPDMAASHKSNFFKWYTLTVEGGIYADMDILWMKPLDYFYNNMLGSDAAICYDWYLSIGLLASKPQNSFFSAVYDNGMHTYTPARYQCAGVENVYNWIYGDKIWVDTKVEIREPNWSWILSNDILGDIRKKCPTIQFYNIPMKLVYPFPHNMMPYVFAYDIPFENFGEETIGIHWYAGCPMSQQYNKLLNEDTLSDYHNTFRNIAERVL